MFIPNPQESCPAQQVEEDVGRVLLITRFLLSSKTSIGVPTHCTISSLLTSVRKGARQLQSSASLGVFEREQAT